jgi:hypothetical protein
MDRLEVSGLPDNVSFAGVGCIDVAIGKSFQQTEKMKNRFILIIVLLFVILSAAFFAIEKSAPQYDFGVLMGGNIIMVVLAIVSYVLVTAQINKRPEAFVRGVYSSTFLKLFVCIVAILTYALVNKPNVHKPSLFILFGIYAVYSVAETWQLSRMARGK